jgi:hypothetical protein
MENQLNRILDPCEVVHHIDGDKANNDPNNLELFPHNGGHLKATLKGRVPNWTTAGKRRIREGVCRSAKNRRASTDQKSS